MQNTDEYATAHEGLYAAKITKQIAKLDDGLWHCRKCTDSSRTDITYEKICKYANIHIFLQAWKCHYMQEICDMWIIPKYAINAAIACCYASLTGNCKRNNRKRSS